MNTPHRLRQRATIFGCGLAAMLVAARAEPQAPKGPAVREVAVEATWGGVPLRQGLTQFCRDHGWGLVIDRHVDPGQSLELAVRGATVDEACRQLADQLGLGSTALGKNIYLGPRATTDRLRTLVALRKDELSRVTPAVRSRWLLPKAWRWDDLATPNDLLEVLAAEAGARLAGRERLPHDLWAGAELTPLSLVERITLVAAQFDLTYELTDGGQTLTLVPMPTEVTIERSYPGGKEPAALAERWSRQVPQSRVTVVDGKLLVRGSLEDHESLTRPVVNRPPPPAPPGGAQVHTLKVAEVPLDKLLAALEKKLSLTVRVDRPAIAQAGIALDQLVSLSVERASTEELFRQLLQPLKLACRINGATQVNVFPAEVIATMENVARPENSVPGRLAVYREVLTIALPLMVSTMSWTVMHFIDRVLLLGYSSDAVAAATPAGVISYGIVALPLGIAGFTNTFVAQYFGAGRPERIGLAVWQGVFVGLIAVPAVIATIPLAPLLFGWGNHGTEILAQEITYYQVNAWGGGSMVLSAALSSFFTGRGRVRVVMTVDSLAALMNIVLDTLWIYGYCGFPRAGIAGAAWATVVALWFKAIIYLVLFLQPRYRREFGTWSGCRFDYELFRRLLRYGLASGLQLLIDVGAFWAYLMAIGRLGVTELAATSLAFNVNSLAFMPVYGIGIATTTLVGQHMGAGRPDLAALATRAAFVIAAVYMIVLGAIYVGLPDVVMLAHWAAAEGAEHTDITRLRELTVMLLWFVAAYSFSDAMAVCFSAALKGAGDTGFVLAMAVLVAVLLAGLSWGALVLLGWGLWGLWGILTGVIFVQGMGFWLRFLGGRWRTMTVIESRSGVKYGHS